MQERRYPGEQGRRPTNWRGWALLVLVVLLVIFVLQNSQEVEIKFLFFGTFNTALIFALVIAALLGALIGWLAPRIRRRD